MRVSFVTTLLFLVIIALLGVSTASLLTILDIQTKLFTIVVYEYTNILKERDAQPRPQEGEVPSVLEGEHEA